MLTEDTIRTLIWGVVALFGIQGVTTYAIVKMLTSGRAMLYERKGDPTRVVQFGSDR